MTEQSVAEANEAEALRRVWWLCHAFVLAWLVLWMPGGLLVGWKWSMLQYMHGVRGVAFASAWGLAVLMLSTGNRWVRYTTGRHWWILPLSLVMVSGAINVCAILALESRGSTALGQAGLLVLFFWLIQQFLPEGPVDPALGENASRRLWRDALAVLVIPCLLALLLLAFPKLISKSSTGGRALLLESMPLLGICLLVWKHGRSFRHPRLAVYTLVVAWLGITVAGQGYMLRDSSSPVVAGVTAVLGVPAGTMLLLEVGSSGETMHLMSPFIDGREFEAAMAGRRNVFPFRLAMVALESSRWLAGPLALLILLAVGMATARRRWRLVAFALSVPVVLLCLHVEGISIITVGYSSQTSIQIRTLPRGATWLSFLLIGVMLWLSAPRAEVVSAKSARARRWLIPAAIVLLPGLAVVLFLPAAIAWRQEKALAEARARAETPKKSSRIGADIYRAYALRLAGAKFGVDWAPFNKRLDAYQQSRAAKTALPAEAEQLIGTWRSDFKAVTRAIAEAEESAKEAGVEQLARRSGDSASLNRSLEPIERYALAEGKILVCEAEQHAGGGRIPEAIAAMDRFWRVSCLFRFVGAWEWNRILWEADGVVEGVIDKALENSGNAIEAETVKALEGLVDAWLSFIMKGRARVDWGTNLPVESKWPIRLCVEPEMWRNAGMYGLPFYLTRSEMRAQGQRLRIRLIRYHLERGEFPDNLNDLFDVVPADANDKLHPIIDSPVWVNFSLTKKSADEVILDWSPPQGSSVRLNPRWGVAPITIKMPPRTPAGEGTDAPKP